MAKKRGLKKCPICKSLKAVKMWEHDAQFAGNCDIHQGGCGCTGGWADTKQEAKQSWNTRGERYE